MCRLLANNRITSLVAGSLATVSLLSSLCVVPVACLEHMACLVTVSMPPTRLLLMSPGRHLVYPLSLSPCPVAGNVPLPAQRHLRILFKCGLMVAETCHPTPSRPLTRISSAFCIPCRMHPAPAAAPAPSWVAVWLLAISAPPILASSEICKHRKQAQCIIHAASSLATRCTVSAKRRWRLSRTT